MHKSNCNWTTCFCRERATYDRPKTHRNIQIVQNRD